MAEHLVDKIDRLIEHHRKRVDEMLNEKDPDHVDAGELGTSLMLLKLLREERAIARGG